MGFLIVNQWPLLAAVAVLAGIAGWAFHCMRERERWAALRAEREDLRRQLEQRLAASIDDPTRFFDNDHKVMEASYNEAQARILALQGEIDDLNAEHATFAGRFATVEQTAARVPELERALMDAEARADRLALDLSAAQQPRPEDGESARENATLREQLSAMSLVVQELERRPKGDDLDALRLRLEELEARPTEDEMAALRSRIAELEAALEAAGDPADELNRLRWKSRYLSARVDYLEGQPTAEAIAPAVAEEPVDPEAENRKRWRLRYLEARLAWLEDRATRADRAREDAEAEVDLLQEDREKLTPRIAELEAALAAARESGGEIERLRTLHAADITDRDTTLAGARERIRLLEEEVTAYVAELERLRARIAEADGMLAGLRSENAANVKRIADVEAELSARMHRVEALEGELAAAKARIAELERLLREEAGRPRVDDGEHARLLWRSRYLENRVRFLEDQTPAAMPAPQPVAAPEPVREAAPSARGAEVRPLGLPAARGGAPDDLRLIDGVAPRVEQTLNALGVFHFDQIAAWTPENVAWVERYLAFRGRISRERWVEQAEMLAAGHGRAARSRFEESL